MSRILDFYAVRWEYEPHTFPILWNLDGDVVESFSPDFYLPDLDLHLEMTTLRQNWMNCLMMNFLQMSSKKTSCWCAPARSSPRMAQ